RLLGGPLLRVRVCTGAWPWPGPAGPVDHDRHGKDRGDRHNRVWTKPTAPAEAGIAAPGGRCGAKGLDPRPGLLRTAGDVEADAGCGGEARLSELRVCGDHQQHAGSGVLATDPGSLPRAWRA